MVLSVTSSRWSPERLYAPELAEHFDEEYMESSLSHRQQLFKVSRRKPDEKMLTQDEFINVFAHLYTKINGTVDVTYNFHVSQTTAIKLSNITIGELAFLVNRRFNLKKYFTSRMAAKCVALREVTSQYEALGWAAVLQESTLDHVAQDYLRLKEESVSFEDMILFTESGIHNIETIIQLTHNDVDTHLLTELLMNEISPAPNR